MKRILIALAIAAVIGGFLIWWLSPSQVVKRRTHSLMSTMTLEKGSGMAARQLGVYSLNGLIADELILETPTIEQANGTFPHDQIESGFSWLGSQASFTKFEVETIHSIEVDGNRAKVKATIEGTVVLSEYRPADGMYDVELDWVREEDGWKLTRARWVESR